MNIVSLLKTAKERTVEEAVFRWGEFPSSRDALLDRLERLNHRGVKTTYIEVIPVYAYTNAIEELPVGPWGPEQDSFFIDHVAYLENGRKLEVRDYSKVRLTRFDSGGLANAKTQLEQLAQVLANQLRDRSYTAVVKPLEIWEWHGGWSNYAVPQQPRN